MSSKTPISYYGGKQNMLNHILPLIPTHSVYVEPFFGGGAVFFAKEPSPAEVINDNNHMVVNFYAVVKSAFADLKAKIEATLFARATYAVALAIYKMPHLFNDLQKAWAFYVACNMGFASSIGSWGYDKYGKRARGFLNKKMRFDSAIADRLEAVTVECSDAYKVIASYDSDSAFHYIDPPYIHTEQRHYSGYSEADYIRLLDTLSAVKGKFLLSSFPSDILSRYVEKNGWHSKKFYKSLSAQKMEQQGKRRSKIEVLTANYPLD